MIEIRHRVTNKVLFTADVETVCDAVEKAVAEGVGLVDANLVRADLVGANLAGADLGGADLGGAYLRGAKITASQTDLLLSAIGIEVKS